MNSSTSTPQPECPPWCTDHPCTTGFHIGKGEPVTLRTSPDPIAEHNGILYAYASLHRSMGDGAALGLSTRPAGIKTSGPMTRKAAELVARLAELLADATPEAHREVAAVIRRAVGIADGNGAGQ